MSYAVLHLVRKMSSFVSNKTSSRVQKIGEQALSSFHKYIEAFNSRDLEFIRSELDQLLVIYFNGRYEIIIAIIF